jgi:hypothetical protein
LFAPDLVRVLQPVKIIVFEDFCLILVISAGDEVIA